MMNRMIAFAFLACAGGALADSPTSLDPAQLFATADKNGDGQVSKQEFLGERAKRFGALDANGDGVLSGTEFAAAAPGVRGRLLAPLMFGQFDANGDGRLTRQEFDKAPTPGFDGADSNGDGKLGQTEMKAALP